MLNIAFVEKPKYFIKSNILVFYWIICFPVCFSEETKIKKISQSQHWLNYWGSFGEFWLKKKKKADTYIPILRNFDRIRLPAPSLFPSSLRWLWYTARFGNSELVKPWRIVKWALLICSLYLLFIKNGFHRQNTWLSYLKRTNFKKWLL